MKTYLEGYSDGLQRSLDIVNRAADYLAKNPDTDLDVWEIIARIITDIQIESIPSGSNDL